MSISVIVTNWNGISLLKKYFQSVIDMSPEADEIIFTDDASEDDSVEYIKTLQKKYKKIKIITHQKNVGFGENTNHAVSEAKGELVVLLNSDIRPHRGYISACLPHFKDKRVFGVGFAELGHENWARIYWSGGYLQHEPGKDVSKTHISAWVSGGSSIIRKSYFQRLNGFDTVYKPFYGEDLDLGLRAWKSGYLLLWEPTAIVEHKHESTISKFPKHFLDYVKERNRLLTTLRNIDDPKLLRSNYWGRLGRILSGPNYYKIVRAANKQIKKNPVQTVFPVKTDREILSLFSEE